MRNGEHRPLRAPDFAPRRDGGARAARARGFTYIGLLLLVAIMGVSLSVAAELWHTAQQRDKEEELLFVGGQIRHAIAMYAANVGSYPHSLKDMEKDPTFPGVRRYLRRVYPDPVSGKPEWGLVMPDGNAITGVYSLSEEEPIKKAGFDRLDREFEGKTKYSDWKFVSNLAPRFPAANGGRPASAAAAPSKPAREAPGGAAGRAGQTHFGSFNPRGSR